MLRIIWNIEKKKGFKNLDSTASITPGNKPVLNKSTLLIYLGLIFTFLTISTIKRSKGKRVFFQVLLRFYKLTIFATLHSGLGSPCPG